MSLTPAEYPELRELLARLGSNMSRAGDSVDAIQQTLLGVAHANGVADVEVIVFPTVMLIQTAQGAASRVELLSSIGPRLRLDQVSVVYEVARRAERCRITPAEGLRRLDEIATMRPMFGWPLRTVGHAALTGGLALLLQPSWQVFVACVLLGLGIGVLKLTNLPTLDIVFPVVASFAVALVVLAVAKRLPDATNPLRTLIPPLVTFLPGAALTIGTVELAANQMIAGASRVVYGILQLLLLAFGIVAAASLVKTPEVLQDRPVDQLGWWAPWLGVLIFGLGIYLHYSAPTRSMPWILLVLSVTHAAQALATLVFAPELSGFFGAFAMTPLVFWVARTTTGPPSMVTFLPAFWLLVPGAAGLLGVTELFGSSVDQGAANLTTALGAIIAIALGVLIGTAFYRTARSGWHLITEALPRPSGDPV